MGQKKMKKKIKIKLESFNRYLLERPSTKTGDFYNDLGARAMSKLDSYIFDLILDRFVSRSVLDNTYDEVVEKLHLSRNFSKKS